MPPTILFRPENIIIALLNYFPHEKTDFPANRQKLHSAFYELKKINKDIFEEFTFNTNRMFPTSEELDQALSNLEFCKYLGKFNPALNHYTIKEEVKSYFDEKLSNEFSQHLEEFEKLSRRLQELLGI